MTNLIVGENFYLYGMDFKSDEMIKEILTKLKCTNIFYIFSSLENKYDNNMKLLLTSNGKYIIYQHNMQCLNDYDLPFNDYFFMKQKFIQK
jgi:hypothetical protein